MSEDEIVNTFLPRLETGLRAIVGEDLAESLVKAARAGDAMTLDLQLALNDGLEEISDDQRTDIITLIDTVRDQVSEARNPVA